MGWRPKARFYLCNRCSKRILYVCKSKYKNEIFNLGEGKPKSINLLIKLIGGGKVTYLPNRPGEPKITLANISKIRKFLNWKTKVSFKKVFN